MAKKPRGRSESKKRYMHPYALAIGQLALAWNELHDAFGLLFMHATTFDVANMRQHVQLQAVWGAITSDRQKREMVQRALRWIGGKEHSRFPKLGDDVTWSVGKGHALEDHRNNVLHSALYQNKNALVAALMELPRINTILPGRSMFGRRADNLQKATIKRKRDLLAEVHGYRDAMIDLTEFVHGLHDAWQKQKPWPERPRGPHF